MDVPPDTDPAEYEKIIKEQQGLEAEGNPRPQLAFDEQKEIGQTLIEVGVLIDERLAQLPEHGNQREAIGEASPNGMVGLVRAAEFVGVSKGTLSRWCTEGLVASVKHDRRRWVDLNSLANHLASRDSTSGSPEERPESDEEVEELMRQAEQSS
jgi:hypothetical protein